MSILTPRMWENMVPESTEKDFVEKVGTKPFGKSKTQNPAEE